MGPGADFPVIAIDEARRTLIWAGYVITSGQERSSTGDWLDDRFETSVRFSDSCRMSHAKR